MPNFSFLEGVILTLSVGWEWVGGWVGGVEICTIRLNSVPLSLSWGLTELGNIVNRVSGVSENIVFVLDAMLLGQ